MTIIVPQNYDERGQHIEEMIDCGGNGPDPRERKRAMSTLRPAIRSKLETLFPAIFDPRLLYTWQNLIGGLLLLGGYVCLIPGMFKHAYVLETPYFRLHLSLWSSFLNLYELGWTGTASGHYTKTEQLNFDGTWSPYWKHDREEPIVERKLSGKGPVNPIALYASYLDFFWCIMMPYVKGVLVIMGLMIQNSELMHWTLRVSKAQHADVIAILITSQFLKVKGIAFTELLSNLYLFLGYCLLASAGTQVIASQFKHTHKLPKSVEGLWIPLGLLHIFSLIIMWNYPFLTLRVGDRDDVGSAVFHERNKTYGSVLTNSDTVTSVYVGTTTILIPTMMYCVMPLLIWFHPYLSALPFLTSSKNVVGIILDGVGQTRTRTAQSIMPCIRMPSVETLYEVMSYMWDWALGDVLLLAVIIFWMSISRKCEIWPMIEPLGGICIILYGVLNLFAPLIYLANCKIFKVKNQDCHSNSTDGINMSTANGPSKGSSWASGSATDALVESADDIIERDEGGTTESENRAAEGVPLKGVVEGKVFSTTPSKEAILSATVTPSEYGTSPSHFRISKKLNERACTMFPTNSRGCGVPPESDGKKPRLSNDLVATATTDDSKSDGFRDSARHQKPSTKGSEKVNCSVNGFHKSPGLSPIHKDALGKLRKRDTKIHIGYDNERNTASTTEYEKGNLADELTPITSTNLDEAGIPSSLVKIRAGTLFSTARKVAKRKIKRTVFKTVQFFFFPVCLLSLAIGIYQLFVMSERPSAMDLAPEDPLGGLSHGMTNAFQNDRLLDHVINRYIRNQMGSIGSCAHKGKKQNDRSSSNGGSTSNSNGGSSDGSSSNDGPSIGPPDGVKCLSVDEDGRPTSVVTGYPLLKVDQFQHKEIYEYIPTTLHPVIRSLQVDFVTGINQLQFTRFDVSLVNNSFNEPEAVALRKFSESRRQTPVLSEKAPGPGPDGAGTVPATSGAAGSGPSSGIQDTTKDMAKDVAKDAAKDGSLVALAPPKVANFTLTAEIGYRTEQENNLPVHIELKPFASADHVFTSLCCKVHKLQITVFADCKTDYPFFSNFRVGSLRSLPGILGDETTLASVLHFFLESELERGLQQGLDELVKKGAEKMIFNPIEERNMTFHEILNQVFRANMPFHTDRNYFAVCK